MTVSLTARVVLFFLGIFYEMVKDALIVSVSLTDIDSLITILESRYHVSTDAVQSTKTPASRYVFHQTSAEEKYLSRYATFRTLNLSVNSQRSVSVASFVSVSATGVLLLHNAK